jgi:putative aldouronate transport system permease protein
VAKKKPLGGLVRFVPVYLMMLPGLAYLFINNYMPLPGVVVAFKNYDARKGIFGSDWVGFANFEYLFKTSDAWTITRNTLLYNFAFLAVNTLLAVAVAILLSELTGRLKKAYQSIILLPNLLSSVIVGYLAFAFLSAKDGFLNHSILPLLGLQPVSWYSQPQYWPVILILVSAWKSVGYTCILYLAAILGIDHSIYESARIDGASKARQIFHLTLPLLKPTAATLTLMAVGRIFYSDFGLFYQTPMNQGALFSTTNTIDTYVYRGLLQLGNISMSAAAGLYQSVVGFLLVLGANALVRWLDRDSALI